jgi:hypothetical protein
VSLSTAPPSGDRCWLLPSLCTPRHAPIPPRH